MLKRVAMDSDIKQLKLNFYKSLYFDFDFINLSIMLSTNRKNNHVKRVILTYYKHDLDARKIAKLNSE